MILLAKVILLKINYATKREIFTLALSNTLCKFFVAHSPTKSTIRELSDEEALSIAGTKLVTKDRSFVARGIT